jgi:hypothetical protein
MFKDSAPTSENTASPLQRTSSELYVIIASYYENRTEHIKVLCEKYSEF